MIEPSEELKITKEEELVKYTDIHGKHPKIGDIIKTMEYRNKTYRDKDGHRHFTGEKAEMEWAYYCGVEWNNGEIVYHPFSCVYSICRPDLIGENFDEWVAGIDGLYPYENASPIIEFEIIC